jgi:holo-[acyl-carrier protein] synthase
MNMIIGLGLDLVEISRMEAAWRRFGRRFAERILHPLELDDLPEQAQKAAEFLAGRFAAKEAAVKALGTGFAGAVSPHELRVRKRPAGQPEMIFLGPALERMRELGADGSFLSITHSKTSAAAVLVLTGSRAL